MPGSGREGATAVVATAALTEVVALPEQVAVVGVGARAGLQQRGCTRTRGANIEVIDDGVLIDLAAATVGVDAVGHGVADLVGQIARNLHHAGIATRESRHAELTGQTERGAGLGEAFGPVEVLQRRTDGGTEITELEVPLTGHRAGRQGHRDTGGGRSAQQGKLGVAETAGADLDGAHEHLTTLILIAITEEDGRRGHRAASGIQTLVGGPVILLDAVHVLHHHRRRGGHVVGRCNAVPGSGREGAAAVVAAAALTEVATLPEQVAVVGVARRTGLQQRSRTRTRGAHEDVIHNGVLVDLAAAAVGVDAVGHDVADLVGQIARHLHHAGVATGQSRHAELAGQTERGSGLGEAFGPVEVVQRCADGGTEITELEVPLTGDRARRNRGRNA